LPCSNGALNEPGGLFASLEQTTASDGRRRVWRKRRAQHKDKPPPPLWKRVAALCEIVGLATLIVAALYSAFGPPRAFRQGAFAVFRQELAQLPPFPNSVLRDETDIDGWSVLYSARVDQSYTLDGDCVDVHAYYEQLAVAHSWTGRASAAYTGLVIRSEFRKTVGEYTLSLQIDCYIDPTSAYAVPGYSLVIETG
jgi:hypothetical protein